VALAKGELIMPRKIKEPEKKNGRRGNNEGSIYQRKDGRWCAQITMGYMDTGKPIMKYTYGASRQEVAKKLAKLTNEVFENGYTHIAPGESKVFNELFEEWYLTFKEATGIRSTTAEKLRNYTKNHIYPAFDRLLIEQVDFLHLQKFFNGLGNKGLCQESRKQIKQLINQFYKNYAIKRGLCRENPIDSVNIRTKERPIDDEHKALDPVMRKRIITLVNNDEVLKPIITVLLLTGMRPGELLALKWNDMNFDDASISIRQAVGREVVFNDDGSSYRKDILTNTKTVLSVRSFKVPKSVVDVLLEWKEYQKEQEKKKNVDFTSSYCHIFTTKNGDMRTYSGLRNLLRRFLTRNNPDGHRINLYSVRHTFATMLLEKKRILK